MSFSRPRRWLVGSAMIAALTLMAAPAQAQVMTFESAACVGGATGTSNAYSEAGFTLSATATTQFGFWCDAAPGYSGSTAFVINLGTDVATLVRDGGGVFSLFSIDIGTAFFGGSAGSMSFTGFLNGGGSVNTTFNYSASAGTPVLETFFFGAGWSNLTSVQFGDDALYSQFDNVAFSDPTATVPEPATMTLLATGLAGMAAARRKKRQA